MTVKNEKKQVADYEWAIKLNRINLFIFGIWPEPDTYKCLPSFVFLIATLFMMAVGFLLPELYALLLVWKNLPLLLDNISVLVAVTVSVIKIVLFWINKKQLRAILRTIKSDWSKEKEDWEEHIMIQLGRQGRSLTLYAMFIMAGAIGSISVGPIFGISLRMINNITDRGHRFLPFQAYYPYDVSKSFYFEISYLLQIIGSSLTGACFSGLCSFFSVLIFYTCSRLDILTTKIKLLDTNHMLSKTELLTSKSLFNNNLKIIVREHVKIIKTINMIEQSFTIDVLAQLTSVTVLVICMGVQFLSVLNETNTESTDALLHMILLSGPIANALLITFIYCFAGQKLSNHSIEMSNSIYEIRWYMAPRRFVADMSFILLHSKRQLQLTAGKVIFLNFETYCNIVKSTAGYLSMLIAVRDK